jgi:DNA-directed RNA polymerase subunit RPC12/RpoP
MIVPTIRAVCPWCGNRNAWIASDNKLHCNKCGKVTIMGKPRIHTYWKGSKIVKKIKR